MPNRFFAFTFSAMLLFVAFVLGASGNLLVLILLLACVMPLLFFAQLHVIFKKLKQMLYKNINPPTLLLEKSRASYQDILYGHLVKYRFFSNMNKSIQRTSLSGAIKTGSLVTPLHVSKNIVFVFAVSFAASIIISLIGVFVFFNLLFLLTFLFPLFVRLYPGISNKIMSSDMASSYDDEFAYFLAYLQISTAAGLGLYLSMAKLLGKNILHSIERDANTLKKWVSLDGYSESIAINSLALNHSHKTFQSFLFSYYTISKSNTLGLDSFVSKTADVEFEKIITQDEKSIGKVTSVFMYGAMAMIMAPIMMLTMMFMQTDPHSIQYIAYVLFLIPVMYALYVFFTNSRHSDVSLKYNRHSLFGLAFAIPWFAATHDWLASISLGILVMAIINGVSVSRQLKSWRSKTDGFPIFIRDLIERRKVDSNFIVSIKKLLKSPEIGKKYMMFSEILEDVRARLYEITYTKKDLFYDPNLSSKRLRLMMFILQIVFDGGYATSTSSLERVYNFSVKLNFIKNKIDDSLKTSSMLLFFAPLMFFVSMVGLSSILMSFTVGMPDSTSVLSFDPKYASFLIKPDFGQLLDALKPALVIMSVCSGLVISRVTYATFFATLPLGLSLVITFVILVGWDFFFDVISNLVNSAL